MNNASPGARVAGGGEVDEEVHRVLGELHLLLRVVVGQVVGAAHQRHAQHVGQVLAVHRPELRI